MLFLFCMTNNYIVFNAQLVISRQIAGDLHHF